MYKILTYNNISVSGLEKFPRDKYEIASEIQHPDAIMLRSYILHDVAIPAGLKAVGRAGAGVNNIPLDAYSERGIPVFNAPGANANAVKELVIAGLLLASRNICQAWDYVRDLEGDDASLKKAVEAGKKRYVGGELPGKTLGIIGLGAIGVKVANSAYDLGMEVIGSDPHISINSAWNLSSAVMQAGSVDELLERADFVTVHVPYNDDTRHTISEERIQMMKDGAVVLNFARDGIVDDDAVIRALDSGKLSAYVCDFPTAAMKNHPKVIALPHLGASTAEAEDNCAVMIADQLRDFLENGNITHSVNFPSVKLPKSKGYRLGIANRNVPHMFSSITTALADAELNILDLLNQSKGDMAYTLIDLESEVPESVMEQILAIDGVLSARVI